MEKTAFGPQFALSGCRLYLSPWAKEGSSAGIGHSSSFAPLCCGIINRPPLPYYPAGNIRSFQGFRRCRHVVLKDGIGVFFLRFPDAPAPVKLYICIVPVKALVACGYRKVLMRVCIVAVRNT